MKSAEGTPFDEGKPAAESSNGDPDSHQIKETNVAFPPDNKSLQGGPRTQRSDSAGSADRSPPAKSSMKASLKAGELSPRPPLPPKKKASQDASAPFDPSKLLSQQMTADDTVRANNTSSGTNHLKSDSIEISALFMPPQPNVGQINDIPTSQPTFGQVNPLLDRSTIPKHQREVSWDMNVVDKNKKPSPTVPFLPVLSRSGSSDGPTVGERIAGLAATLPPQSTNMNLPSRPTSVTRDTSQGSATHARKLSQETNAMKSIRRFDLDEFIKEAPLELEAETLLLQTLEEREPMRTRSDTNGSIFESLPVDHGVHGFSLSPMSSYEEADSKSGLTQNENFPPVSPSPSSFTAHTRGMASATSSHSKRDLLERVTSKRDFDKTQRKNQGHRRNMTLEETLFGLTSALETINVADNDSPVPIEIGGEGPMRARADTGASTDRLASTMDTLYKRVVKNESSKPERVPTDDASGNSNKSDASANWKLLGSSLKKHKTDEEAQHHETPIEEVEESDVDMEEGGTPGGINTGDNSKSDSKKSKRGKKQSQFNPFRSLPYAEKIKEEWEIMHEFLRPRQSGIYMYCKYVLVYLMLPALGIAAILYHLADNPPTGKGKDIHSEYASASFWLIFICIRQVIVATLAKCTEVFLIDFLALQTRLVLKLFGPLVTLLIVQSKGWPFLLSSWGVYNFALLAGSHPFARHWLFWQDWLGLFNDNNPSGSVTNSENFYRTLTICTCVGVAVSIKRLAVGLYLGRQTFGYYAQPLSKVMNKMLLISEVSNLAREIEQRSWSREKRRSVSKSAKRWKEEEAQEQRPLYLSSERLSEIVASADAEDLGTRSATEAPTVAKSTASLSCENVDRVIDIDDVDPYTGLLSSTQKSKVSELLGQWEEPDRGHTEQEHVSVSAVLQFRRALAHMNTDFPFSASFGLADTRENCVASAQDVYQRLLLKHEDENYGVLKFDTFAVVALNRKGVLDTGKIKELIRLFRPNRDGSLNMLDFVRSVDAVYKELRLLRATVASSSKIDKALESIINILFYAITVTIILSQTGFDPLTLFLSLSSIILAFAFMIGSASAKYFDGLLLILVQRPYGIGDRINVSNTEVDSGWGGSQGWIVNNVTLFTTTIVLAGTGERATISNGALAKSRIINGARSPKATLYVTLKIGLDVPYQKIEIFKSAVEKFVKARPREWLSLAGFRVSGIFAEQNYVEYSIILQHREKWQNMVPLLDSRHTIHCFCLELSKKMKMRYHSPSLPVDLKMVGTGAVPAHFQFNNSSGEGDSAAADKHEEKSENQDTSLTLSPRSSGDYDDWNSIAALFEPK